MRINVSLAHDQHSKVALVKSGMTLTAAVSKNGIPFKAPPKAMAKDPAWKAPPPSKDGSQPQP